MFWLKKKQQQDIPSELEALRDRLTDLTDKVASFEEDNLILRRLIFWVAYSQGLDNENVKALLEQIYSYRSEEKRIEASYLN